MGRITRRARKDGSTAYRVGIVIKQNGKVVHKEAKSFDREVTARSWMTRRERDLHKPGGLEDSKANKGTVANLITVYLKDLEGGVGRTKAQVLRTIQVDLHRFCSCFLRAILAIKETGYGVDTQRRVQAGCG
jgi:hypothetical protein